MNKKNKLRYLILLVVVVSLLLSGAVLAANTFEINPWVIGGGGARVEQGDYVLNTTVGQAVVGDTALGSTELCTGFWCGMGLYKIKLPVVVRND